MSKKLVRLLVLLIVLIVAGGVIWSLMQRPSAPAKPAAPVAAATVAPPTLEFLPKEVVTAAPVEIRQTLSLSGSLRAVDMATVKARVAADVRQVLVREGESVRAGQIVVVTDGTEYEARVAQARGNLDAARAQLEIATKTRDNNRVLVEKGFISRNAFDNAASQYAAAEANVAAARGAMNIVQKSLNDTVIRTPISGLVAARYVQPGEKVSPDNKLLDIVNLQKMELEAAVPTSDIAQIVIGQPVSLHIEGLPETFEGKVARINPSTQTGSRSVLVYVQVANPKNVLRVGMFAEAQLVLRAKQGVLALPQSAVRKDSQGAFVYTIANGQLSKTAVTVGIDGRSGEDYLTEIVSGLDFGAQVVRTDMGNLQTGTRVRVAAPATAR
jgi:membrane fusion protein, multidrug efflux system